MPDINLNARNLCTQGRLSVSRRQRRRKMKHRKARSALRITTEERSPLPCRAPLRARTHLAQFSSVPAPRHTGPSQSRDARPQSLPAERLDCPEQLFANPLRLIVPSALQAGVPQVPLVLHIRRIRRADLFEQQRTLRTRPVSPPSLEFSKMQMFGSTFSRSSNHSPSGSTSRKSAS
jgi:hypothetical protein